MALTPPPCPVAFKRSPEDFVVEELPAYAPSGSGDHLYVTFRKTLLTTDEAVRILSKRLGAEAREAGVAGIKDKVGVTTQTASFLLQKREPAEGALADLGPGLEVLSVSRHGNKLKPGHLHGNRFRIALPLLTQEEALIADALARLQAARGEGVPNHYGHQRFGRDGGNFERALAFVTGGERPPRDKNKLRFLFSALQSELFNRVLDRRLESGTWTTVLPGDLAKKADSGGMFLVPSEGPELEDAAVRAGRGELSATGPMFGASMRSPEGVPAEVEADVLAGSGVTAEQLAAFHHAGEGTRRPLRVLPDELALAREGDRLLVTMVLPKGAYATTFLSWACQLVEERGER